MARDGVDREIFDRLQRAMAADPQGLADLYREYLTDARRKLGELEEALLQNDEEQLRTHAHYLKGSSQITGVRRVAEWCAALERIGGDGDSDRTMKLVQEVAAALDAAQRVSRLLEQFSHGIALALAALTVCSAEIACAEIHPS